MPILFNNFLVSHGSTCLLLVMHWLNLHKNRLGWQLVKLKLSVKRPTCLWLNERYTVVMLIHGIDTSLHNYTMMYYRSTTSLKFKTFCIEKWYHFARVVAGRHLEKSHLRRATNTSVNFVPKTKQSRMTSRYIIVCKYIYARSKWALVTTRHEVIFPQQRTIVNTEINCNVWLL